VLNVDRLAYASVKGGEGAAVIADERILRTQGRRPPPRRA